MSPRGAISLSLSLSLSVCLSPASVLDLFDTGANSLSS